MPTPASNVFQPLWDGTRFFGYSTDTRTVSAYDENWNLLDFSFRLHWQPGLNIGIFVWDGTDFWISLEGGETVYKYSADGTKSDTEIRIDDIPVGFISATWDGTHFWALSSTATVFQLTSEWVLTGISFDVDSQTRVPRQILWDGTDFWILGYFNNSHYIFKYNSSGIYQNTRHLISLFTAMNLNLFAASGFAWDGASYWVIYNSNATVNGATAVQINASFEATGLSYALPEITAPDPDDNTPEPEPEPAPEPEPEQQIALPAFAFLHASNVTEDDYDEWDMETTYKRGAYVISIKTHRIYRSLFADNTGNDPVLQFITLQDPFEEDPSTLYWQDISATNLYKLFDSKPSHQCQKKDVIKITLASGQYNTGLAFFNLAARSIDIQVNTLLEDGTLLQVHKETVDLNDNSMVVDMLSFYTAPLVNFDSATVNFDAASILNMPVYYPNSFIDITINNLGSIAGCGQIVVGKIVEMGFVTIDNSGFSGLDFSRVDVDEYGDLSTTRRKASKIAQFNVVVPTSQLSSIDAIFRDLRGGKPIAWIPDEDSRKAALVYGFYRDYNVVYSTGGRSHLNLEIQGIV